MKFINNNGKGLSKKEYIDAALKHVEIEFLADQQPPDQYYASCKQQGCISLSDSPENALRELRGVLHGAWVLDTASSKKDC